MKLTIDPPTTHVAENRLWLGYPILLTLLGIALSLSLYFWEDQKDLQTAQTMFSDRVAELSAGLAKRVDGNVQVLRGLSGFLKAREAVSRAEFAAYYRELKLDRIYPGIQGIGFSQWLPTQDVPKHEAQVRALGFSEFRVQPVTQDNMQSSIVYLEPFDWRNQRAFGYNMFSEMTRQTAMRRSVDEDQPALSGRVTLLQETDTDVQAGFLVYSPVYRANMPTNSAADRWQALRGWAYSPLRAKNLVNGFLNDDHPNLAPTIDMQIFAGVAQDWNSLLYQSAAPVSLEDGLRPVSKTIELYGSKWLVVISPRSGHWRNETQQRNNLILLLVCLSASLMVGYFFYAQARRNRLISNALVATTHAKQQLEENESSLRLSGVVMEASPTGIFVADPSQKIMIINPAFRLITGLNDQEILSQPVDKLLGVPNAEAETARIWSDLERLGLWRGEISFRRKDGSIYPCDVSVTRVTDRHGAVSHYVGMFTDISDRRKDEERIRYLAHHDYLTGLPNRALFVERAESALLAAARYKLRPALFFIDLDRFKPINDQHGHEMGDAVLKRVGERLKSCVRQSDLVCRLGGDEFVVLTPDYKDQETTRVMAEQMCDAIAKPYVIGDKQLTLGASIGIAHYPDDGRSIDELISHSDTAMYKAKADSSVRVKTTVKDA